MTEFNKLKKRINMYYAASFLNLEDKKQNVLIEAVDIQEVLDLLNTSAKEVFKVSLTDIKETYPDSNCTKWCKVTMVDEFVDPATGKAKPIKYGILIQVDEFDSAPTLAREIRESGYDMTITAVSEFRQDVWLKN